MAGSDGSRFSRVHYAPAINLKLLELDNVVVLPHMGSVTIEGRIAMGLPPRLLIPHFLC